MRAEYEGADLEVVSNIAAGETIVVYRAPDRDCGGHVRAHHPCLHHVGLEDHLPRRRPLPPLDADLAGMALPALQERGDQFFLFEGAKPCSDLSSARSWLTVSRSVERSAWLFMRAAPHMRPG